MNDLKNIGIRQFLAWRGILPKYERNGYDMYLSPLREERTPSFKVDYVQNLWYDFGLGEGGTLLTLVMRLERCDSREAVRRLQNGEKRDAGSVSLSPGVGERPAAGGPLPVLRPAAVPALRILSDDSAPASGIGRLSRLARHRPVGRRSILPRSSLQGKRPRLFRRRVPQRCRRMGAPLRAVQRRLLAQTYHHHRQPFRYGNRFRGIYGFPRISLAETSRTTAHRRRGSELGRQPAQSHPVSLPASGDSRLL